MHPQVRQDGLLIQEIGEELVIYDCKRDHIHSLNATAALVWRNCDGQTSIMEIAALLDQLQDGSIRQEIVRLALGQLVSAGLLEDARHTSEHTSVLRRDALGALTKAGAFVLLLPVITSITAPTPAMAASLTGDTCEPAGICVDANGCIREGGTNSGRKDCAGGLICCT